MVVDASPEESMSLWSIKFQPYASGTQKVTTGFLVRLLLLLVKHRED